MSLNVVAACLIKDGHVLATQRGHGASAGGWEFPGGKVEPGETPEAALRREIQEELGAPITVLAHLVTIDHADPASRVTLHCYHATLDGPYELTEHRSARWLDATTLNTVAWLPADRAVLPHVLPLLRESSQVTPARQAGVAPADRPG